MTHLGGYLSPSTALPRLSPSTALLVDDCVGIRAAAMLRAAEKTSLAEKSPS